MGRVIQMVVFILGCAGFVSAQAEPVLVGAKAPGFSLPTLDGGKITLDELKRGGSLVLIVLRGWPGYQCPVCDRQVNEFIGARAAFAGANARLLFVYPGPLEGLSARAGEFRQLKGREWPAEFGYALDQDYGLVKAYGLRWDAPRETAYPSTFIVDRGGIIRFAKVSRTHGDRAKAADVLAALAKMATP